MEVWDECGERPFLWPLTSFPGRHTYSVHSVQYGLSSCLNSSAGTSSGPVALRLAVWRMARATSALAYAEKARPVCAGDNSNGECVAYTHVRPAGNTDAHRRTQVPSEL